ncbi:hypothetical protein [Tsukamurella tyrosinosolvens]|uniref:hypothetical protein n=1 Tax=Tsukamurella tyrosinosolvens TaxID=57704 RepID=UPI00079A7BE6|nr:hypothetical protein [Tsukamurella tyrosinosolvens]KXP08397.1 hypothetical protein AXK59_23640 [Tsukamurella tyrosinosolvens]
MTIELNRPDGSDLDDLLPLPQSAENVSTTSDSGLRGSDELLAARHNLGEYVTALGSDYSRRFKIGWTPTKQAPSTYQMLRGSFIDACRSGGVLPIFSEFCDNTIFLTPGYVKLIWPR